MTDYDEHPLANLGPQDSWQCPHCQQHATIREEDFASESVNAKESQRNWNATMAFITCPNKACGKAALFCDLYLGFYDKTGILYSERINRWQLFPPLNAKQFPDFVPQPIRDDYAEACLIRDLSPKSAATLARRCLQGMIRDFWQVTKSNLAQEIAAIESKVDADTLEAINTVREFGNIGAHMEKEVDRVIDIEPGEAEQLIWLVESLITDWYVARAERQKRLAKTKEMRRQKEAQRKGENNGDPDDTPF